MRVSTLIVGSLAAIGAQEMCCQTCTEPQEKYLSVDTSHDMCGECCLDPKDYKLYHLFEKGLLKANSTTPCADRGYHGYDSTVTHGALNIKVTLDLYTPDAAMVCPGSAALVHAQCQQTAVVHAPCSTVSNEIQARVAGQYSAWHDPHNNGTYSLLSNTASTLQLQRVTGNLKYTDKITITLADDGSSCVLSGCSQSQVTSVADGSTNFCNVRALYCGTEDGCNFAKTDLTSSVSSSHPSLGASASMGDCLKL